MRPLERYFAVPVELFNVYAEDKIVPQEMEGQLTSPFKYVFLTLTLPMVTDAVPLPIPPLPMTVSLLALGVAVIP